MTTEKQAFWIHKMLDEKEHTFGELTDEQINGMTNKLASAILDALFNAPRKPDPEREARLAAVTEGFWLTLDDEVVKIVPTKDGLRHYGKRLEGTRWVYVGGLIDKAAAGHKITLDEAMTHGKITGQCLICGHTLTVKASIERGIGPVCAKRLAPARELATV